MAPDVKPEAPDAKPEAVPPPAAAATPDAAERAAFLSEWRQLSLTASSADYYFNSYNHYGVHEDVLKDAVTTSAYQRALKRNAHLLRGAVVLDVCAGLGLCALLAAQAGAKRVIALESQAELAALGTRLALQNGFGPEVLEFVCGSPSGIEGLPGGVEQVDVIVSDWMGYFLMYEARLADVVTARDRWLKPGGLLFPDRAKLYLALLEDTVYRNRHFDYYSDVWGFDFSAMRPSAHTEPVVNAFDPAQLLSSVACVLDLDLYRCTVAECFQMSSSYKVVAKREGRVHGLLFWFEIRFDSCHKPITFSTGPDAAPTCWKQTAFFIDGPPQVLRQGDRATGFVAVRKPFEARRHLDIKVSCRVGPGKPSVQYFRWS